MKIFRLLFLSVAVSLVHATTDETFEKAIEEAVDEQIDPKDAPNREDGMLYSVNETVDQMQNFFEGVMVGFYHNPHAKVNEMCLSEVDHKEFAFIMKMIYEGETLLHFLDIFKLAGKVVALVHSSFEYCGPKHIIMDVRDFCLVEEKRCTAPIMLTNMWRRMIVIGAQMMRVTVDSIKIIYWAFIRESQVDATHWTSSKLYDIGDDLGSISRYIFDFRVKEEFEIGEFD